MPAPGLPLLLNFQNEVDVHGRSNGQRSILVIDFGKCNRDYFKHLGGKYPEDARRKAKRLEKCAHSRLVEGDVSLMCENGPLSTKGTSSSGYSCYVFVS